MVRKYIPQRGDLVWLLFNPQAGREQMGRRPAVVISPREYNEKVGLAIFCPITSQVKGYPFEVKIDGSKIKGSILVDQVKSLDWVERECKFIEKIGGDKLDEIIQKLRVLIL